MRPWAIFFYFKEVNMYQTVKGTYDILPQDFKSRLQIKNNFMKIASKYGYSFMETPVFEFSGVFNKENDTSDMVTKEMYSFSVNDKDVLTLRPEGTAGIIRSFIQNKMYGTYELPLKLGYVEEMFRHERPQKGRQRQFTQLGVENIGNKTPLIDAELIVFAYKFLANEGLKNIKVLVNTLGDNESRINYSNALKNHFAKYKDELCEDCKNRLEKNPLRILDCKIDKDKDCFNSAPNIADYLSKESKEYFDKVIDYLKELNIPYEIDNKLVRGLDYYTDTVFEIVVDDSESRSLTVLAGGRYDNLVKELGGPELSGIGFSCGLERLVILKNIESIQSDKTVDFYLIDMTSSSKFAFDVAETIRDKGFTLDMNYYDRSMKSQFKSSERKDAKYIVIIGEDELKSQSLTIKDVLNKTQNIVPFKDLDNYLNKLEA